MRLVGCNAVLTEDTLKIVLYGRPPEIGPLTKPAEARCQMGKWLPGQMSESAILWDSLGLENERSGSIGIRESCLEVHKLTM